MKFQSILLLLLLTSCTYFAPKKVKQEAALEGTKDKIIAQAQYMNDATVIALAGVTDVSPRIGLAKKTSTEVQRLIGQHPFERFDVDGWCRSNELAFAELKLQMAYDTLLIKKQIKQEAALDVTKDKLIAYGQKYEEERNNRVWWKFWTWSTGTLIFAGFICLCVFTPVGPAVLSGMVGLLWKVAPSLMGFFKIGNMKHLDSVLVGGEQFKQRVAQEPVYIEGTKEQTFNYEQVQNIIKQEREDVLRLWKEEMAKATDKDDKTVLDVRKRQLNLAWNK